MYHLKTKCHASSFRILVQGYYLFGYVGNGSRNSLCIAFSHGEPFGDALTIPVSWRRTFQFRDMHSFVCWVMDREYQLRSEQFLSLEKLLWLDRTRPELRDSGWMDQPEKRQSHCDPVSGPEQGLCRLWLGLLAIGPRGIVFEQLVTQFLRV